MYKMIKEIKKIFEGHGYEISAKILSGNDSQFLDLMIKKKEPPFPPQKKNMGTAHYGILRRV